METPDQHEKTVQRWQRQWGRSGIFIVTFERILHIVIMFPLLILNK